MVEVVTVGLDIAKAVFQVHGVDAGGSRDPSPAPAGAGFAVFAKLPACLIGIEACATAHYWARELGALGHQVKLIPPSYVKPYVKRQKNDAADAEAICEAVTRPTMRFVEVKSLEQQSVMVLHRVRLTLMRQRIQLSNTIRGHMAEFGLVAPIGREGLQKLIRLVEAMDPRVPDEARICLEFLVAQLQLVDLQILETDRRIRTSARSTEVGRRLMSIPGVGPLLASALVATVADPKAFKSGRNLAAWIGLVPKQNSSGGKDRLGGIAAIAPGLFGTPMAEGMTPEVQDAVIAAIPFPHRFGKPEEFAHLVVALVTNPMVTVLVLGRRPGVALRARPSGKRRA